MKKYRNCTEHSFLFLTSLVLGIFLITILSKGKFPENTMMEQIVAENILEEGINSAELMISCCFKRFLFFGTLYLFSLTVFRKFSFRVATFSVGFSLGMLMKLFFLWYDFWGLFIFAFTLLPHYLFYWMAYGMIYSGSDPLERNRKQQMKTFVTVLGVVIIGCFLESYVNPFFILNLINILKK